MISLAAEQKNLSSLFTQKEQYVIPDFQRPYSWDRDHCQKLYDDLVEAYTANSDYFLGNIIIAVSSSLTTMPNVVDGQQRLISLWLMFKALSILFPDLKILKDIINKENWDGSENEIKIKSKVIEADDEELLDIVWQMDEKGTQKLYESYFDREGIFCYPKNEKKIIANYLLFYTLFDHFLRNDGRDHLLQFIRFILERVSMLPIQLRDNSIEGAQNKALTIFETINDRGLDLSDADIFKARLCSKAIRENHKTDFMNMWTDIRKTCEGLDLDIDDLFRYYMHILRGRENNTRNEIALRDYFTLPTSPMNQKSYKEIMQDLWHLADILNTYEEVKHDHTVVAAWLQLVDAYTNTYPRYAVVTYLFYHGFTNDKELLSVLQSIVRYCYYLGSTTYVKFEVYNMIQMISHGYPLPDYAQKYVSLDYFNYLGRLKNAYALLAVYLEENKALSYYSFDKLLTTRDATSLPKDWSNHVFSDHLDDLGNLVVIDTYRRSKPYREKQKPYSCSIINEVSAFLREHPDSISFAELQRRTVYKQQLLCNFFEGKKSWRN